MTRMIRVASAIFTLWFLDAQAFAQPGPDIARQASEVLKTHCYRCHGENGSGEGGLAYMLDASHLVARRKIEPRHADKSHLYQRIVKKEMPPEGHPRPSAAELAVFREWIQAGAPELRPSPKRAFIEPSAIVESIWRDLSKVPEEDQPWTRYFTLTHLTNDGVPEDVLETYRQGLSKLVNSLSWAAKIVVPTAIDTQRTIFRIDLRDYKWTKRTWTLISSTEPYMVMTPTNSDADQKCRDATQVERYHTCADWFATYSTYSGTYHQILQLPATANELRKLFGIGNPDDPLDRVHRAGFLGSRVTPTGRLIERHESHFGAFWIASSIADRRQLFEKPFSSVEVKSGPGHEVLFHLPNGMLGFTTWDGLGRSSSAPKGIQDVRRPDLPVRTALACMSCHTTGVIAKHDEVLKHASSIGMPKLALDKIASVYLSEKRMTAIFAEDSDRFMKAVKLTGARAGSADPIVALALSHEEPLSASRIAAELGMTREHLAKKLAGTKFASLLQASDASPAFSRAEFVKIHAALVQTLDLGKLPVRSSTGFIVPSVYAEMLLPARGTPSTAVAVVAKKPDTPTLPKFETKAINLPKLPPKDFENRLQVLAVRDHLACQFSGYGGIHHPLAISPIDYLMAAESRQGVVAIFDPQAVEIRRELDAHKSSVTAIAFSPDGKLIATASQDEVKLWRATSGLLLRILAIESPAAALQFAADGKTLAALGSQFKVWSIPGGEPVGARMPPPASGWTGVIAAAADLKTIAIVGKGVGLWDVQTGKAPADAKINLRPGNATAATFSPDGRWLAWAAINAFEITIFDLKAHKVKTVLRGHTERIQTLAFSPDSKLLVSGAGVRATGARSGELKIWEIDIESHWKSLDGPTRAVANVVFSSDGKRLASIGNEGTIRIWSFDKAHPNLVRKKTYEPFEGHFGPIQHAVLSHDKRILATGGGDGTVRLWDAKTGAELKNLVGHTKSVRKVAFSADDSSVYSAGEDLQLIQWSVEKGAVVKKSDLAPSAKPMAFASNGKFLIVAGTSFVGQVNTSSARMVRKIDGLGKAITAIAIADDDRTIAIGDWQRNVSLWDLDTEKVRFLRGGAKWPASAKKNDSIRSLEFSPNRELLLSSGDNDAHLWDLKTGEEIHRTGTFPGWVTDVRFSADGKSFLVALGQVGYQPKAKKTVLVHASITELDTRTGQPLQFWDQLQDVPAQILPTGDERQCFVLVGNTVIRLATENGKLISTP